MIQASIKPLKTAIVQVIFLHAQRVHSLPPDLGSARKSGLGRVVLRRAFVRRSRSEADTPLVRLDSSGSLLLSPSDLSAHLACAHLTSLELSALRGEIERPERENLQAELIRRKGDEHEAAFLATLRAQGKEIVEIGLGDDGFAPPRHVLRRRCAQGAEVVYQGVLASAGWRGIADFLVRVDEPSGLGIVLVRGVGHEARAAREADRGAAAHVLLARARAHPGAPAGAMHVVLGTGARRRSGRRTSPPSTARRADGSAVSVDAPQVTYPYPVAHCGLCDFLPLCDEHWDRDDHLVRVARIRRDQIERLDLAGISTLEALGDAARDTRCRTCRRRRSRRSATRPRSSSCSPAHRARTATSCSSREQRGLGLLPAPSPGDLFYDIEGDPFWEPGRGLEYLHGITDRDGRFTAIWAHDRDEERSALERAHRPLPRAPRRPSGHARLPLRRPTRPRRSSASSPSTAILEEELDELLRRETLRRPVHRDAAVAPDLVSELLDQEGARVLHGPPRPSSGAATTRSCLRAVDGRARPELLDGIERYNEEDCLSTLLLRDWLVERKEEAERSSGSRSRGTEPAELRVPSEETAQARDEREALRERLVATGDRDARAHGRPARVPPPRGAPGLVVVLRAREMTPEELVEDSESIGSLEPDGSAPEPVGGKSKSEIHGFRFPVQQHKLDPGDEVFDPVTEQAAGSDRGARQRRRDVAAAALTRSIERGAAGGLIPGGA